LERDGASHGRLDRAAVPHGDHRRIGTCATFAANPARFSIQNDLCLVVPGAPIDPAKFAVHDGRIYGFATDDCVAQFKSAPENYLKK
jgi:YHS domain-containing protein